MNEELTQLYNDFIQKVSTVITKENTLLEEKRMKIMQEKKDKILLDQRESDLNEKDKDLQRRENDLQQAILLNRDKSKMLDLREQKLSQEKERLKHTLANLQLEEQ